MKWKLKNILERTSGQRVFSEFSIGLKVLFCWCDEREHIECKLKMSFPKMGTLRGAQIFCEVEIFYARYKSRIFSHIALRNLCWDGKYVRL